MAHKFRTTMIILLKASKCHKHSPSLTHVMSQVRASLVLTYGDKHIATLADYLYDYKDSDFRNIEEAKLKAQWMTFKFMMKYGWKTCLPK